MDARSRLTGKKLLAVSGLAVVAALGIGQGAKAAFTVTTIPVAPLGGRIIIGHGTDTFDITGVGSGRQSTVGGGFISDGDPAPLGTTFAGFSCGNNNLSGFPSENSEAFVVLNGEFGGNVPLPLKGSDPTQCPDIP